MALPVIARDPPRRLTGKGRQPRVARLRFQPGDRRGGVQQGERGAGAVSACFDRQGGADFFLDWGFCMNRLSLLAVAIAATCSTAYAADGGKIVIPAGVAAPAGYERIADYGSFSLYRGNLAALPRNVAGVQVLNEADVLQFDRLRLDTQQSPWVAPSGFALKEPRGAALQIIQFVGPLKQEWLDQVRATGAVPVHYVESNGYLVWADNASRAQLAQMADAKAML